MAVRLAVFCISFGVLGYEILLMRLLSIVQWHHFAYMIISLALLGFGASGTFTCLLQRPLLQRFYHAFTISALLFGIALGLSFGITRYIPLNPLEILWDARQWFYLLLTYLALFVPFFFGGACLSLAFLQFKEKIHQIYMFDLLGAGLGALGMVLLLFALHPVDCLKVLPITGFFAAGLAMTATRRSRHVLCGLFIVLCGLGFPLVQPADWSTLRVSQYKGLSMALKVPGARIVTERFSPLGWIAVVESPVIPFRHAPGMSLNCDTEPPMQVGVFVDGDGMSPVTRNDGRDESLVFLDCMTGAVPYHLLQAPRVLVLGAGGGMDVLAAIAHGAERIDAVELDPNMISLVKGVYGEFSGHLYADPRVKAHVAEARGFAARSNTSYDLIQVSLLDSFNTSATGGHALNESYLYTVEALSDYYRHLRPGGILSITRWLKVPPRDSLKLFATALETLEHRKVESAGSQIAVVRSWRTVTLLLKSGAFTEDEVAKIRAFCAERSFDVDYCPGIKPDEPNRYNILPRPCLYEGAQALLGENRDAFLRRYKFYIAPATDDRPYFFHFFKWETLPEILSLKSQGGLPLMEWAYPILVMTLVQACGLSLFLIVLPLLFLKARGRSPLRRWRIAAYFLAIGFAFLFMEIAFIQKLILFLSHPIYAVSVVLCAFLVFAGLGSRFSSMLHAVGVKAGSHSRQVFPICVAVLAIVVVSTAYLLILPSVFRYFLGLQDAVRIAIAVVLLAPLAFFMGMPFPLGLARLAKWESVSIPWAWGINGCASVVGSIAATLLAIHMGFTTLVLIALVMYGIAAFVFLTPVLETH